MRVEDLRVDENVVVVLSSKACIGIIFGSSSNPDSPNYFLSTHHQHIYCIIRRFSLHTAIHYNATHSLFFPFHSTTLVCDCDGDASWHPHWVQCVSVWVTVCLCPQICVYISLPHTPTHTHNHAYIHPYIHTHTHTHTHVHTHVYIHTPTHRHHTHYIHTIHTQREIE